MKLSDNFWVSLIFILFVFIVAIVLLNLLNALAISDTQKIIDEGEIADLAMKVKVLFKYEKLVAEDSNPLSKFIHQKTKVFDETKTGKIIIDLIDKRIKLQEVTKCQDMPRKVFFFMDDNLIKSLQDLINENRKADLKEKQVKEFSERMKNIETTLNEINKRLNN